MRAKVGAAGGLSSGALAGWVSAATFDLGADAGSDIGHRVDVPIEIRRVDAVLSRDQTPRFERSDRYVEISRAWVSTR